MEGRELLHTVAGEEDCPEDLSDASPHGPGCDSVVSLRPFVECQGKSSFRLENVKPFYLCQLGYFND